jgi:hypothetical protein
MLELLNRRFGSDTGFWVKQRLAKGMQREFRIEAGRCWLKRELTEWRERDDTEEVISGCKQRSW